MISLNWVKDYIDLQGEDLNELAIKVTKAGVNVEKVINKRINNLVIGEVMDVVNHPDSDHLHICQVDVGEKIQIVCGAPNVRKGLKVLVALPGSILPGDFEIKKSSIRGVESNGMICALFELGLEEKTEENYSKGIAELNTNLKNGTDANDYLGIDDTLYELDVHKHRNNDCYYHIGFAYEIASILNKKVILPDDNYDEINESINDYIKVNVSTNNCPLYTAKMVKNVVIGSSPEFIVKRLNSAGMRSINNVVDISNYVMLEYGQPLHFFDKNKLGNNILVRMANNNEEIITLDGNKRILKENDILITDGKKPVCIAGIMGGENTDVDNNTKDIVIESAIFDSVCIRNTASRLDLKSEASIRYGKGLSKEYTLKAIKRACYLLNKYASGDVLKDTIIVGDEHSPKKIVEFTTEEVSNLLGLTLTNNDVKCELDRLMFNYENNNNNFVVTIPERRLDIDPNVNDIAEEIGRLYGYQNIISTLPKVETRRGKYVGDVLLRKIVSKRMRSLGLNECKTYTLVSPSMSKLFDYEDKEKAFLPNPMSIDKSILRTTIIPSLLNVYDYNKSRKIEDIYLYEISKTYDKNYNEDIKLAILIRGDYNSRSWQKKDSKCDFYLIKGMIENLLNYLGFKNRYEFIRNNVKDLHPGICAEILLDKERVGIIGKIHPSLIKDDIYVCEISLTKLYHKEIKPLKYKEANIYPSINKDVAFIIDSSINYKDIKDEIKKVGGKLLTNVSVFDIYVGEHIESGKYSMALNLTFEDNNRTLTENEVMVLFNKIIEDIKIKFNAIVRDK